MKNKQNEHNKDVSDSTTLEFINTLRNGSYDELMKLYRYYKGFCNTNSADFVQCVVVDFFETYCTELIRNRPLIHVYDRSDDPFSLFPWNSNSPQYDSFKYNSVHVFDKYNMHNKFTEYFRNDHDDDTDAIRTLSVEDYILPKVTNEHFTDTWDNDFNDSSSNHPSQKVSNIYACNTGLSGIPTIFESKLYFRNDMFYTDIRAEPYVACQLVSQLVLCFLELLHKQITSKFNGTENPWNFKLYNLKNTTNRVSMDDSKNTVLMSLKINTTIRTIDS